MRVSSRVCSVPDFLVVGGGSAGSLLARRLAQHHTSGKVLLLEAGARPPLWTRVPIAYLRSIGNPSVDWCFFTEPEPGLNGRRLRYPRGRVLGGCSVINGMIHMRGQRRDYDGWSESLRDPSWAFEQLLPFFRAHERHWAGESNVHGGNGEWHIEKQRLSWEILDAFADACERVGIPRVADFNNVSGSNAGVGHFEVSQQNGLRLDAGRAFLGQPLPNLTVRTHAPVDRVILEGNKVISVRLASGELVQGGQVILCSGAIGSPAILERSGIGASALLESAGIKCLFDMPQVGENLQDHLQLRHVFRVKNCSTLNTQSRSLIHVMKIGLEYIFGKRGPLSMAPSQLGVFSSTKGEKSGWPNVQYHVQPLSLPAFGEPLHKFDGFTAAICNLRPTSRGSTHIRSARVDDAPKIRPNYLSTESDRKVAVDSIHLTREIVASMDKKYAPEEVLPGQEHQSEEQLVTAAGSIGTTIFHPVGTCAMGKVVDSRSLLVNGIQNLRVCDASVMPTITSGNTNAPCLMIAEKLANELK